jgi:IS30 family transposase
VSRELKRLGGAAGYSAVAAQAHADRLVLRPKKTRFESDPQLAAHVEARLCSKDSPMTISVELAAGLYPEVAGRVSHEQIYAAVYAHGNAGLAKGLHAHLHRRRRCRKRRLAPGEKPATAGPLKDFKLIALRPPEADGRSEVGHLEGDLIVGSFNRSAIATVLDRASRHVWLADLPEGHGAESVLAALIDVGQRIPETLRRTLTRDQGREMADHHLLTDATGIDIYFADPHSPWQRPTNENGNGLLRRYVGKGTDLSVHTPQDLRAIEHSLNTMPRRIQQWSTAATIYNAAVAPTT